MIDFHAHILPGIDDGSRNVEESLSLLGELKHQGVDTVAATSHFYASRRTPESFLERRQKAYDALKGKLSSDTPKILLGAEVYYFPGISRMEGLDQLCIGDSNLLLLEMPFETWSQSVVREVEELALSGRVRILVAHIERYYQEQPRSVWQDFLDHGILMQSNVEFFLSMWTRRRALRLLKEEQIHVLGTDCHNMESRRPRMGETLRMIEKRCGKTTIEKIDIVGRAILNRQVDS